MYLTFNPNSLVFLGLALPLVFFSGIWLGFGIQKRRRIRLRVRQNSGEGAVSRAILADFKPPHYYLLNNLTLPFQDGSTQVDHILVSTHGVFVIETKAYQGWIFGQANARQWTQVIYRQKSTFQNPIRQNYKHLQAVRQLLDFLPPEQVHSLVVFAGSAEFKTPVPPGVVYLADLKAHLAGFTDELLSANRVELCVGRLECRRFEVTGKTDLQHRAYLEQKFGGGD